MSDSFLLLTPVLMLAIVALVAFIGCRYHFDPIPAPKGLTANPHCIWINLSWNKVNEAKSYGVVRNDDGNFIQCPVFVGSGLVPSPGAQNRPSAHTLRSSLV